MSSPPTPPHVAPDEEVTLPSAPFAGTFDLNPDLDDETPEMTPQVTVPIVEAQGNDLDESDLDDLMDDVDERIVLWTQPFDVAYDNLKNDLLKAQAQTISNGQQSKLVNYLDAELLQIQRKFVKNQAEIRQEYSLDQLLTDLGNVVDLLWYLLASSPSFGQDEYFVKIMGDLDDWVSYYALPAFGVERVPELERLFTFFQKLDTRLSALFDGIPTGESKLQLTSTEVVRLMPIVSRLRFAVVSKLDLTRAALTRSKELGNQASGELLNILDLEIGRLFEGLLERI